MAAADVFAHGVGSGDPLADRVVIWTRVSGAGPDGADVERVMATDPTLRDTPERVPAEWWHVDTVLRRSNVGAFSQRYTVERGEPRLIPTA